eukprot:RCo018089
MLRSPFHTIPLFLLPGNTTMECAQPQLLLLLRELATLQSMLAPAPGLPRPPTTTATPTLTVSPTTTTTTSLESCLSLAVMEPPTARVWAWLRGVELPRVPAPGQPPVPV